MNAPPPVGLTTRAAACALLGCWLAAAQPAQAEVLPIIDSITVDKSLRRLYLIKDGKTVRAYRIALGLAPEGRKMREGDYRTPEGKYYISVRKADSSFMLALQVSYPSEEDRAMSRSRQCFGGRAHHGARAAHSPQPRAGPQLLLFARLDRRLYFRQQFRNAGNLDDDPNQHPDHDQALTVPNHAATIFRQEGPPQGANPQLPG